MTTAGQYTIPENCCEEHISEKKKSMKQTKGRTQWDGRVDSSSGVQERKEEDKRKKEEEVRLAEEGRD